MSNNKALGIDIGGSHISAAIVDLDNALVDPQTESRVKIDPSGTAQEIIDAWARAIGDCFTRAGLEEQYIGIAMPGPFDYEQGISLISGLHKFESLYGLNVKQLLAARLSISPAHIKLINDASAFLLGEVKGGAGRGFMDAAGITLGTGLGSAGYFGGVLHEGDLWCTPFKETRAEDYICSRWFVQEYEKVSGKKVEGVKELMALYDHDPLVPALFRTFGQHLAQAILLKYPPGKQKIVVIGGNIAKAWDLFIPAAEAYFREKGITVNLQPALLGERAAIIGAAFLHA